MSNNITTKEFLMNEFFLVFFWFHQWTSNITTTSNNLS